MIQCGDGVRLALEPGTSFGIACRNGWKNLQSDLAVQSKVPRPIHLSHAPSANQRQDFVSAEAGAWSQSHLLNRKAGL
jgi:hypothetical protein